MAFTTYVLLKTVTSFLENFRDICHEELGTHALFLNLETEIKDGIFVYNLFDKTDAFSFEIDRIPFICSNFPSITLYSAIFSEILRIIQCTL